MNATEILLEIEKLPVFEQILVAEQTLHAIRTKKNKLETGAEALIQDYKTDPNLTAFLALDSEEFYEAR